MISTKYFTNTQSQNCQIDLGKTEYPPQNYIKIVINTTNYVYCNTVGVNMIFWSLSIFKPIT